MKNIYKITFLFFSALLHTVVIAQDNREIFEGKVNEAPLNSVLKAVTYNGGDKPGEQTINSDVFDMNVFNAENETFTGTKTFEGFLSYVREGLLQLTTSQEETMYISYAFPRDHKLDQGYAIEDAVLKVSNLSDPGSSIKEIVLRNPESLEVAFLWKSLHEPIAFESSESILLFQDSLDMEKVEKGYHPTTLNLKAGGETIPLKAGESKVFRHNGQDYTCYVQESTFLKAEDDGGCSGSSYILRAFIIKK